MIKVRRLVGIVFIRIVKINMAPHKHIWIAPGHRGHELGRFIMLTVHHGLPCFGDHRHGKSPPPKRLKNRLGLKAFGVWWANETMGKVDC